jgi:hypothetical protein
MSNKEAVSCYRKRAKTYATKAFGSKCGICGYDKCVQALDFHHINPEEKIFNPSMGGVTRSWEILSSELRKCVCLCSNCHREVHAGVTNIPENITRFNESYAEWDYANKATPKEKDNCPQCGTEKLTTQKYCSNKCASAARTRDYPPLDELISLVKKHGYTGTGRLFNCSDNAIRKRIMREQEKLDKHLQMR